MSTEKVSFRAGLSACLHTPWLLAVVMLVGSMGCELVALFLGKIANGEKPDFLLT